MALSKAIATDYGIDATYWWITMPQFQTVSPTEMRGYVQISGYASKEVRDAGKGWLRQYAIEITTEMFGELLMTSYDEFTKALHMTKEQFDALMKAYPLQAIYSGLAAMLYQLFQSEAGGLLEGAEWVE